MERFAITGAAGFIGSHLAERLIKDGHEVIAIDNFDPFYSRSIKERNLKNLIGNPNFHMFNIDVRSEELMLTLANTNVDTIIHLSARAGVRPSFLLPQSYIHHDVEATVNILESCRKLDITRLIFGSSSSVYGNMPELPYSEDIKLDKPISPYAAAKLSCELFNYVFHSQYGINITNLRFFTVYGPRQRPEMGIHKFTRQIWNNELIHMYGDGSSSRDYTYIDDIIEGLTLAIKKVDGYHTFNLGNSQPVLLKELIETIGRALDMQYKFEIHLMQPGDVDHTLADISKARKELNYNPSTSIKEGIDEFVKWFRQMNRR
ncbi:MAG: GDP-mannose 4,6-dehydratase [Candidatus Heimdallarchaeota archaeon]|nr:GDP-mannose 4,6-dehydratase [Candidatus Heimdallarchaeota archaeon]